MPRKFRRKHFVKAALVALYLLMIVTMIVGWAMRGY